MKKNILVIAPHCDDEVLGCGGTMAKLIAEGNKVYVIMVTNGNVGAPELFPIEATRLNRKEAQKSMNFLGVKDTVFFDFPAPRLDTIPSYKLSIAIHQKIMEFNIDTLYIPHRGDIHKDHRITYEASIVAARPIGNCPVKSIYSYETLSETEWAAPFSDEAFIPNVFVNIEKYIELKKEAFTYYKSQMKVFPHPRSLESIENLSMVRGVTVGYRNAEAFMLVREIKG
jgi:LmbE family N-acetylglucosaminyl deacetylase